MNSNVKVQRSVIKVLLLKGEKILPHFIKIAFNLLKLGFTDQNTSRVTVAREHLWRFNHEENKFCTVTWDEMWVRYAAPETKAQSRKGK